MELELWWLLALPLFFGMGWLAARIDIKHLLKESRAMPSSYFKGLNFLLNEQPDKAIEAFIEVVRVEPQTIDLHFALGSLFRRQGEIERAIRMHQSLLERPDLPSAKHSAVIYELAQDFHRAGLLDRAEELFNRLGGSEYEHASLTHLVQIYEQEKDWNKAIGACKRMEALARQPYAKEVGQYCCELAASALAESRFADARAAIDRALAEYKLCVRANILAGDLALAEGKKAKAIAAWKRVESQNPAYLSLVAGRIASILDEEGENEQAERLLLSYQEQYPSLDLLNALFERSLRDHGPQGAMNLIKDELRRNPTLPGLDKLLEAQLLSAPAERRHDLELVKGLVHQHTRRLGLYRCEHCGFRAKQYYWRCPGCGKWETYSPRRTEAPEAYA